MKRIISAFLLVVFALAVISACPLWGTKAPAVVRDMGYCADVGNEMCAVRDYWPRYAGNPTGVDAYWLQNTNREVCFVTNKQYQRATIGYPFDCLWRQRRLS